MTTIRSMTAADLDAVERISAASPEAAQWGVSAYGMLLTESARGRVLVAEQEGLVVGFVCFRILRTEAEVLNLAVPPSWRRRGLGSRMLSETLREVSSQGASRVFLEVRKSNEAAIRLYERHGLAAVGSRPGYYKDPLEDAVILARDLEGTESVRDSAKAL